MAVDYEKKLAADMLEFIRMSESHFSPDAIEMTVAAQRKIYLELSAVFSADFPNKISKRDDFYTHGDIGIPIRHYKNNERTALGRILFFHGGGFILGDLETHDSICADLCAQTCCDITAVDYRLAPEYPHPAAYEDCLAALQLTRKAWAGPIVLVGDSAGGNLAAAVAHAARGEPYEPEGQVLIYPALGGDMTQGSYIEHKNAPLLSTSDMAYYEEMRSNGKNLLEDVNANPLAAKNYEGLPNTIVFAAECDPLYDDGQEYCLRIADAGGKADFVKGYGLVHGYLRARMTVKQAADSFREITKAVDKIIGLS